MKRCWDAWNRFFFAPGDPLPAAMCRLTLGMLCTAWFVTIFPYWDQFYDANGVLSLNDPVIAAQGSRDTWSVFVWTEGLVPVRVFWWVGCLASVYLMCGYWTRTSSAVLFVLYSSIVHRAPVVCNGEELVARLLLLYGMFSPWGACLSVDSWLARRHHDGATPYTAPRGPMWAVRMMQIHVLLIYVISLPYKFAQDPTWLSGDALHWTVASDMWWRRGMFPWITLSLGGALRKAMTWGTLIVETLIPILVWNRRTVLWAVASMMALHLGIAMFIPGVAFFTLSMVVAAWLYVPGDLLRAWGTRLAARWANRRPLVSGAPLIPASRWGWRRRDTSVAAR